MALRKPLVLPSQAILKELLDYDPESGVLRWRARTGPDALRCWNSRWTGKVAFTTLSNGYHQGCILGQRVFAHRVAWKWWSGEDAGEIDHINGEKTDNRIANLRSVTRIENSRNQRLRASNKTGVSGVFWVEEKGFYQVTCAGRNFGRFTRKSDAIAARRAAERELGFHPNHGRRSA